METVIVNSETKSTVEVEIKFLHYSCGYWDFPKSGEDVNPKIIDANFILLGPCTPAETRSNGYKFKEDQIAIQVYNAKINAKINDINDIMPLVKYDHTVYLLVRNNQFVLSILLKSPGHFWNKNGPFFSHEKSVGPFNWA